MAQIPGVDQSLADPLPTDPLPLLQRWIDEASDLESLHNPLAMALATVGRDRRPTVRMVICRGFDTDGGSFVFYSDARSPKGEDLERSPRAALVLYWDPLNRQVRVDGPVTRLPDGQADAYWDTRPRDARLSAWASHQSRPIETRRVLEAQKSEAEARFAGVDRVPRPDYWAGYRVWAERIELWVSREGRLHDRGLWTRTLEATGDTFSPGPWTVSRLQP